MQIVIEMPDDYYDIVKRDVEEFGHDYMPYNLIANGKPLAPLGEEMRITQKSITDEKVLIGFNMAIALCNKHFGKDTGVSTDADSD